MKITAEMLRSPQFTPEAIKSVVGVANSKLHFQAVGATLATQHLFTAEFDGELDELIATASASAAAGESMTIDVLKNGATVLTATTAFAASGGSKVVKLLLDPDKKSFVTGDVFTTSRVYTAGGGPTPVANTTVIARPTFKGL